MAEIGYAATKEAIAEGVARAITEALSRGVTPWETMSDLLQRAIRDGVKEWLNENSAIVLEALRKQP